MCLRRQIRPSGEPMARAFKLDDGMMEIVGSAPSLDVTVLADGFRPHRATLTEGEREIYLERAPLVLLHLPGLQNLAGAEARVKITLANTGPTDLPASLQGADQKSGRSYRIEGRRLFGGSAWLGGDDTVRVPLASPGRYQVSMRREAKGADSIPLAVVNVPLAGAAPAIQVRLDLDQIAEALGQNGGR